MTTSTLSNVAQQHPGRTGTQLTQPKQVHGFTEIDKYLLTHNKDFDGSGRGNNKTNLHYFI